MTEPAIREFVGEDEPAVLELLRSSLGWEAATEYRGLFRWKHLQNPVGRSAMWVAELDHQLVGFRALMRWRFVVDGVAVDAVRAVDTATAPEARGAGVFRTLTMHAVQQLCAAGTGFVFNTPNDQSRPGYLRMGWEELGRPPVTLRFGQVGGLLRTARSRTAAELFSVPTEAGHPAESVLGSLADELVAESRGGRVRTDRTADWLWWRYAGFPALGYRAVVAGDAVAVFRLRRRGAAVEAAVCEVLGDVDRRSLRKLLAAVTRQSGADHVLRIGAARIASGEVRVPGGGPLVTWRPLTLASVPPFEAWRLSLGDVELL